VQPWSCRITTFLIKNAVRGESQRPAGNSIVSDELLTTVDNISNLSPDFIFAGEVRVFTRSTPEPVASVVELVLEG
jgi:hypothetical protein